MTKKILFFLLLPYFSFLNGFEMPQEFYVTERWVSFTRGFDIETPQQRLGTVFRSLWSFHTAYDFYDHQEHLLATARMRWLSFGAVFDVFEMPFERSIGTVEEEIFTWYPTFRIFSPSGEKLGIAEMSFWGTSYEVIHPLSNQVMATLKRSFFRVKDDWKVSIENPELMSRIDPRLFITLMAFQTDCDHWKAEHDSYQVSAATSKCDEDDCPHKRLKEYNFYKLVEPAEQDYERVIALLDEALEKDVPVLKGGPKYKLKRALNIAFKFFNEDSLSAREKAALYRLIERRAV